MAFFSGKNRFMHWCVTISIVFHVILIAVPGLGLFSDDEEEVPVVLEYNKDYKELPRIREVSKKKQLKNNPKKKIEKQDNSTRTDAAETKDEYMESEQQFQDAMMRYQDIIKQHLEEARRYPYSARKNNIEGIVYMRFLLMANGNVKNVELVKSSGHSVLDESALKTVKIACPFPRIPESFNANSIVFEVSLVYDLK